MGKLVTVPCGKCAACLSSRRESWTIRLLEEAKVFLFNYFLTLTYSDENLPKSGVSKRDFQLFMKRFRKRVASYLRFYVVGEYGTHTFRPHYHLLLFSPEEIDIDIVEEEWGKGHVWPGKVEVRSVSYVAKYHVNRTDSPSGLSPPFCLMSKGIGRDYVSRMQEYHSESLMRNYYQLWEFRKPLPRYYRDKLYSREEREEMAQRALNSAVTREVESDDEFVRNHPDVNLYEDLQARKEAYAARFFSKNKFNDVF